MAVGPSNRKESEGGDHRGQVGPLGVTFVFAFAIIGAGLILLSVGGQLSDGQQALNEERAEKSLTQFDSKAALVALGNTNTQTVSFASSANSEYTVEGDSGWLRIATVPTTGGRSTVLNTTLGALTYENDGDALAYQGGGVWRASDAGGTMISPPEFHYQNTTLTFPVVSITNNASLSEDATITQKETTKEFPRGKTRMNPVTDRKIEITVKSRFYRGWGEYFEERTQSQVRYNHDRSIVNITLVPPPEPIEIDSGVVTAGDLNIKSGASGITGSVELGGTTDDESSISGTVEESVVANQNLTDASTEIAAARQRLRTQGAPSSTTVEAGTYYASDDSIFGSQTTFNTSGGDIEVFVDGTLSAGSGEGGGTGAAAGGAGASGGNHESEDDENEGNGDGDGEGESDSDGCTPGSPNLNVTGDGSVTIYVNGEFKMNGQTVWGNCAQVDSLTVYSKDVSRITELYGVVYTDALSIQGQGNRKGLVGALVSTAGTVKLSGNAQITYDGSLGDTTIQEVETKYAGISYMHVTHNEISVE